MNIEQQQAFDAIVGGKNIFLTGPAGTGKSFVIKKIREWALNEKKNFAITSLTGSASILIEGRTLHSTLGLGLGKHSVEQIIGKLKRCNKTVYKRLLKLDLLIIDEISMMSDELFEKVSEILCMIKNNNNPFGGIQIILSGDFCQLGPVEGDYCFKSSLWTKTIEEVHNLSIIVRQNEDKLFLQILRFLRKGKCTQKILDKLLKCKDIKFPSHIKPTRLFARKSIVENINQKEYRKLINNGAKEMIYTTNGLGDNPEASMLWASQSSIPLSINVCIGCQIVITANINQDTGIINGTRGVVVDVEMDKVMIKLLNGSLYEVKPIKIKDDTDKLQIEYMPLKYAWCLTIHSSQGMTIDAAEIDLGTSIFAHGQAYTALSRVKNLGSVRILDVQQDSFIIDNIVKKFYNL